MSIAIIAITCLVSYVALQRREFYFKYLFNPYQIQYKREWYRFVSHLFVHADLNHLAFNMLTAYFFMPVVIAMFCQHGMKFSFILFYLTAGIVSSLPDYLKHKENIAYNAVGASGALSAVVFYFIYYQPMSTIYVFFLPMPAVLYAVLFVGYSIVMTRRNLDNIGHLAHLTGALYGLAVAFLLDKLIHF